MIADFRLPIADCILLLNDRLAITKSFGFDANR
jgi:hypothetical protein